MSLHIIHFLLAVNHNKLWVQTHFSLIFVNKKYPVTYILLWKGGWFGLFTHFANKKPSASPRAFYCCKMCKKSKSLPFLYYRNLHIFTDIIYPERWPFCQVWGKVCLFVSNVPKLDSSSSECTTTWSMRTVNQCTLEVELPFSSTTRQSPRGSGKLLTKFAFVGTFQSIKWFLGMIFWHILIKWFLGTIEKTQPVLRWAYHQKPLWCLVSPWWSKIANLWCLVSLFLLIMSWRIISISKSSENRNTLLATPAVVIRIRDQKCSGVHEVDFSGVRDDKCNTVVGSSRVKPIKLTTCSAGWWWLWIFKSQTYRTDCHDFEDDE